MKALTFNLSCPLDGGTLELVTQADPIPRQLSAITRCEACGSEHHLLVQLHTTNDTRFRRAAGSGPLAGIRRRGKG